MDMTVPSLIPAVRRSDARGWFAETYSEAAFDRLGISCRFVQDNHSFSRAAYTLRGLHFQAPPHAQAKLVRCIRGRIFDVAVDIRTGSPSYGQWLGAELSARNGHQLFVPAGFAHGFLTLEEDCEITYKVSDIYAPDCEGGIGWDDPAIAIDWPMPAGIMPYLSPRDAFLPPLSEIATPFFFDGGAPLAQNGVVHGPRQGSGPCVSL
ncbi:dTDP-4-dehydrorhamnose 3,5-epimerase [Sphingobium cloacae]|nr:dTDP-4-dehydrorhamnose 3,5-epimerase [Sphingobium cloacae]